MRKAITAGFALIAVSTMATAGAAHADPVNDRSVTITLSDCVGPAGTPSSFDIAKIPNPGAALHLVNGTGTFVLMNATDETTGLLVFTTPGFEHNDLALVTCSFVAPITVPLAGHTIVVSGQMTPASG
jgi:hypothetical protein